MGLEGAAGVRGDDGGDGDDVLAASRALVGRDGGGVMVIWAAAAEEEGEGRRGRGVVCGGGVPVRRPFWIFSSSVVCVEWFLPDIWLWC